MRKKTRPLLQNILLMVSMVMTLLWVNPSHAVDRVPLQAALMELNEAVESYQMGNRPEALQTLLSIATTPQYPQAIQQEARIYIGEILYLEGNTDGAREYFLETLMTDADYNIDRFRHPPEICAEFDLVNAQFRQRQPPVTTNPVGGQNWTRFAPFGLYQFQQGLNWKGIAFGGIQLGTGISSLVLFNYLSQNPGYNANDTESQQYLERLLTIQRASAIGFYTFWLLGSLDAQRDWQLNSSSTPQNP